MNPIHLKTELPDAQVDALEKTFLDSSAFDGDSIAEDVVAYKPNGEVLFKLIRNVIPMSACKKAWNALRTVSSDASHRIVASGGATQGENGVSETVGYLDRSGRHGLHYCRLTSWSMNNAKRFAEAIPFFRAADRVFAHHMPERHKAQMAKVRATDPAFIVHGTAFTTVTVNKNFQTAVHKDSGDLKEGFGVIACLRAGEFTGGEMVFPKYRVAVKFDTQDVLLCDVHEWHGNTRIVGTEGMFERISCVLYYRTGMTQCLSPDKELKRLQNRKVIVVNGHRRGITQEETSEGEADAKPSL
ncbi:MAG: hypothetical protein LAO78_09355 [Acidobacteriia bacterium]|nr:hypothetical protein [Terriglobia bacterium]